MTDERDLGKVALWKPNSENPNAPQAKGHLTAHRDIKAGESLDISLWRNQSDNPKAPVMSGKIQDKYQQQNSGPDQGERPEKYEASESDIPF